MVGISPLIHLVFACQGGSKGSIHSAATSFIPGEHDPFPKFLESATEISVRFSDFGEIDISCVTGSFERLHTPGHTSQGNVEQLLCNRRRVPINLSGSEDMRIFKIGAAAGLDLDARVTMTVSTYTRTIESFTLIRLIDTNDVIRKLQRVIQQGGLPFGPAAEELDPHA